MHVPPRRHRHRGQHVRGLIERQVPNPRGPRPRRPVRVQRRHERHDAHQAHEVGRGREGPVVSRRARAAQRAQQRAHVLLRRRHPRLQRHLHRRHRPRTPAAAPTAAGSAWARGAPSPLACRPPSARTASPPGPWPHWASRRRNTSESVRPLARTSTCTRPFTSRLAGSTSSCTRYSGSSSSVPSTFAARSFSAGFRCCRHSCTSGEPPARAGAGTRGSRRAERGPTIEECVP